MAITAVNKTSGLDETNTDLAYTTASVSFSASRLYLVSFVTHSGSAGNAHSASGGTLTFTSIVAVTFNTIASPAKRLTVFRCMPTSPETTTVSLDQGAVVKTHGRWSIDEFDGVDTSGTNGSGAIVQSNTNNADSGSSLTVTLGAFGGGGNASFGAFSHAANEGTTFGSGFTELADVPGTEATTTSMQTEWQLADADPTASWATSSANGGIGIEIKAAAAGGGVVIRRTLLGVGV